MSLLRRLRDWTRKRRYGKPLLAVLLFAGGLLALGQAVDVHAYLESVQGWIWSLGPWGPVAYGALYVGATLVFVPGTPFTVLAAFLFGAGWGFVTMVGATTASAVAAFLIARHLARATLERRLADTDAFKTLVDTLDANPWIAIPFVRLMPIFPFAVNNYALGITRVSFWSYLLWSEVVFLPMNAILILGAGAIYGAMIRGEMSWGLIGGTTGAGAAVLALGYVVKRSLGTAEGAHAPTARKA